MRQIFVILLIFSSFLAFSQDVDLSQFYSTVGSHENLNNSSTAKLDSIYKNYLSRHGLTDDEQGVYKDFVYKHNFFLEKLNKSGRVYSGDEITIYLNRIKDIIMKDHVRKDQINILLTDFDQLNAFTNDFGNVYVNIGTIAKLDNENELYLLLAHEISHVLSRHSFKLENLDDHLSNGSFEGVNDLSELDYHKFSRAHELEADSLAIQLLKNAGRDVTGLASIFHKLKHANEPVYDVPVKFYDVWSIDVDSSHYIHRLTALNDTIQFDPVTKHEDSLTTHPSARQRLELYQRIVGKVGDVKSNSPTGEFEHFKELATFVLVKTLLTEHSYAESLYLTSQLLKKYPNNAYLQKTRLKLLLLITQSKYLDREINIINEHGGSCTDSHYLAFRKCFAMVPALEMNMLMIQELNKAIAENNDAYYNRLKNISYQFLYRYNPKLIVNKNGIVTLNDQLDYSDYSYDFKSERITSSSRKKQIRDLKKEGFIIEDNFYADSALTMNFITSFTETEELKQAILEYRQRRDKYESMLTLDQFVIEFDPKKSFEKDKNLRKGEFISYRDISDSASIALIQSDTYCFRNVGYNDELDYEQSLMYEEMINTIIEEEGLFDVQLANKYKNSDNTTIAENHLHHLLSSWIGESLNFTDLVYSVADEELQSYGKSNEIDYVVYNLNLIHQNKRGRKFKTLFYYIYFDIHTMGVAYVSKIAGSMKPKKNYMRHYLYQSYTGKQKP